MKKIVVLGSTGCLGVKTLELIEQLGAFELVGISAHQNAELLNEQARRFQVAEKNTVLTGAMGAEKLIDLVVSDQVEVVVNNLSGISGLNPTLAALDAGKTLLTANKESIVAAGEEIVKRARPHQLIPLDSEHNGIFEISKSLFGHCDRARFPQQVQSILLPCSGGPFYGKTRPELATVTPQQALKHPKWSMGPKISIESATLLNKALEVIEAHYLFNFPVEQISVRIHPQCQIHAALQIEGHYYGYFDQPEMSGHIRNALCHLLDQHPGASKVKKFQLEDYQFFEPDHETFPSIPIVLDRFHHSPSSLKNFLQREEEAIADFLSEKISFLEIYNRLQV